MHLASTLVILFTFLCLVHGRRNSGNILMDPSKSAVFLEIFIKNAVRSGSFSVQQVNINNIIQTLKAAMSEAQAKAASSAFASVIADLVASDGDGGLINKNIQSALEKTFVQMGEQVDGQLIQNVCNQIRVYKDESVKTNIGANFGQDHGTGERAGFGLDDGTLVRIAEKLKSLLVSSKKFDQAAMSGIRKSVFFAIVPAVRGSFGTRAGNALAHCLDDDTAVGLDGGVDVGIGLD